MSIGRWVVWPPNPPRPPPIRFLFVEHAFCYQLPSDSTSPLNPCRVANLSPHRAGSGFAPYRKTPCWAHHNRVGPVITRPSHTTWHAVRHQGGSSKHPYVPDAVRRAFSKLYHPSDSSTLLLRPVCRGLQVTMCQYRLLE